MEKDRWDGRLKLAVGAASLFLFLVGVKRTFRKEDGSEIRNEDFRSPHGPDAGPSPAEASRRAG